MVQIHMNIQLEHFHLLGSRGLSFFLRFYSFIFRREGEKHRYARETPLVAPCMGLDQGLNPHPRHVPRQGIKPAGFSLQDDASIS